MQKLQVEEYLQPLGYHDKPSVKVEINALLGQLNTLYAAVDTYVYNNGAVAKLLKLHCTIPVSYKARQYNIPMTFWFPYNFPAHPPICYVIERERMKLAPNHKYVDAQGLTYHPYLHGWRQNENHSLVSLIGILCSEFGKSPPLYAKRDNQDSSDHENKDKEKEKEKQQKDASSNHVHGNGKDVNWWCESYSNLKEKYLELENQLSQLKKMQVSWFIDMLHHVWLL